MLMFKQIHNDIFYNIKQKLPENANENRAERARPEESSQINEFVYRLFSDFIFLIIIGYPLSK